MASRSRARPIGWFALAAWVVGCGPVASSDGPDGSASSDTRTEVDDDPGASGGDTDRATPVEDSDTGGVPLVANALIILADDVGTDAIQTYGENPKAAPTPTLDALAAEGALFRTVWAAPNCSPARALLLTGRYAKNTGLGDSVQPLKQDGGLPDTETTIADVLAAAPTPFSTGMVGKWHLSAGEDLATAPARYGFDRYVHTLGNLTDGHALDGQPQGYKDFEAFNQGVAERRTTYALTDSVDDALDLMATLPEPWFVYLSLHSAHGPLHVPPDALRPGDDPANWNDRTRFDAMVTAMDVEVGRLLDDMAPAMRDRTNVVFLGDNGTPGRSADPPLDLLTAKQSLFEGGVGVPLIVAGPAVSEPGVERGGMVHLVDVLPTLAELAGADVSGLALDGISFVPVLQDADAPGRALLFADAFEPNGVGLDRDWHLSAVRSADWKLMRNQDGVERLYDLRGRTNEVSFDGFVDPIEGVAATAFDDLKQALDDALGVPTPTP